MSEQKIQTNILNSVNDFVVYASERKSREYSAELLLFFFSLNKDEKAFLLEKVLDKVYNDRINKVYTNKKGEPVKITTGEKVLNFITSNYIELRSFIDQFNKYEQADLSMGKYVKELRETFEKFPKLAVTYRTVFEELSKYLTATQVQLIIGLNKKDIEKVENKLGFIESKFIKPSDPKDATVLNLSLEDQKKPEVAKLLAEAKLAQDKQVEAQKRVQRGENLIQFDPFGDDLDYFDTLEIANPPTKNSTHVIKPDDPYEGKIFNGRDDNLYYKPEGKMKIKKQKVDGELLKYLRRDTQEVFKEFFNREEKDDFKTINNDRTEFRNIEKPDKKMKDDSDYFARLLNF